MTHIKTRIYHSRYALKIKALAVCALLFMPQATHTAQAAESCDAGIETQHKNKAMLAAQRQNVVTQKEHQPTGSTMEYSCFDKLSAEHTADRKGIFSESTAAIGKSVDISFTLPSKFGASLPSFPTSFPLNFNLPGGFSETAITGGVINGVESYISDSFTNSFLGGISGFFGGSTGAKGGCETIKNGIEKARSTLITDNMPMPELKDLVGTDPRQGGTGTGITTAQIDASNENKGEVPPNHRVNFLSSDSDCGEPRLSNAQTVQRIAPGRVATLVRYNDAVCFVPGCTYKVVSKTDGATGICSR